jgi:hypothetical protein
MQLHIDLTSAHECVIALRILNSLMPATAAVAAPPAPQPVVEPVVEAAAPAEPEPEVEKPKARKPKAKEEAPVAETPPWVEAAPKAQPLTIDDLRAALQRFTAKEGMPAGIELLKGFGCNRISELAEKPDAMKGDFVAACPVLEAA